MTVYIGNFANKDCKLCKGEGYFYTYIAQPTAPGRNDVCLCGSGKKYKKCCWNTYRKFGRTGALRYCSCVDIAKFENAIRHEEHNAFS